MFLARNLPEADNRLFSLSVKQDLTVGIFLVLYNHFLTHLACAHPRYGGGGRAEVPNLGYMYPKGYICLSERVHLRLAI